jgi:Holliday junction DNA helicase RuvB
MMQDNERVLDPAELPLDEAELSLRPRRLREYIGQQKIKDNLGISIEAATNRREPLDHLLLSGPPGLGKTTLAHIIANEMDAPIRTTSGPAMERAGDLAAILTNLEEGSVLFIDEIHRLNRVIEEILYPAMEDFTVDLIIGKGPSASTLSLPVKHFTLIGATTRSGLLSSPLRDRFGIHHHFVFYTPGELHTIIMRSADILDVEIEPDGAAEIARRSRGTPRIANRVLKRVRDYAQVRAAGVITKDVANEALLLLEVDHLGLDEFDRKLLRVLIEKYNGGPVGVETLAAATSEERDTIEDVYEPYLMQLGFLARTPRGRIATASAWEHLGLTPPPPSEQAGLFGG